MKKNFNPQILKLILKAPGGEELKIPNFDILYNMLYKKDENKICKLDESEEINNLNMIKERDAERHVKNDIINVLGNTTFNPNIQII